MATTPTLKRMDLENFTVLYIADCDETAENDVMEGPCRIFGALVDTGSVVADVYLKLYDSLEPTVGTTVPDKCIRVVHSDVVLLALDSPSGIPFATGLSVAMVTTPGTAGSTGPASAVPVTLLVLPGVS